MYFNGIPQGFGQAEEQPDDLMDRPFMGYTQGIGSLPPQNTQRLQHQPRNLLTFPAHLPQPERRPSLSPLSSPTTSPWLDSRLQRVVLLARP